MCRYNLLLQNKINNSISFMGKFFKIYHLISRVISVTWCLYIFYIALNKYVFIRNAANFFINSIITIWIYNIYITSTTYIFVPIFFFYFLDQVSFQENLKREPEQEPHTQRLKQVITFPGRNTAGQKWNGWGSGFDQYNTNQKYSSNLRRSLLRFSTRPNEWGTQWD